eukprot:725342-Rhodomonas_salina.1
MAQDSSGAEEEFECQVCVVDLLQQTGKPPIYDCGEGHLLCEVCFTTLQAGPTPECPTCKKRLEKQRNRPLEKMRDRRLKETQRALGLAPQDPDGEPGDEAGRDAPPDG